MSSWKVRLDSLGDVSYEFLDTRRNTGREVLRPEFLRDLAKKGELIEEEMHIVGPEGKGRYTDTFLIISLSDKRGGFMMLMENYLVGVRIVGIRGKVDISEKLVDLLQDTVRYSKNINVNIIIPKGYKI
ncbi:MAG: hypothetical protein ACUVXA_04545 [Candidatus Jordarchaeum sp.]|uniref:hypothetical protein n=1 Tax=Candidatus Jordarchaeum sp. TaxID=2823881 RepID=UPI00404ABB0A